ncbi:MAG: FkbM family methyltransferase [Bacteroidetes bacterium]|nr:FkbM family methyltransferase [Bacteroidota bacterium]
MDHLVKPGMIVLDIGSNIGFYSVRLAQLTGSKGAVHCFEPDRDNFKHLKDAVQHLKHVHLNNAAVSDKDGELTIYTSHRLNVDHRTYKPEKYEGEYQVKCIAIDNYLKADTRVDFIKMDIQGAEVLALKGMEQLLKRSEKLAILSEFAPAFLEGCKAGSASEMIPWLSDVGYATYKIDGNKFTPFNTINYNWKQEASKVNGDFYFNILIVKGYPDLTNESIS